ncbi:MAG: hypothetical protein KDI79_31500 [Anaerolineae bacterium]|nr:hypothetical protein [Anaerolineae bacterium]
MTQHLQFSLTQLLETLEIEELEAKPLIEYLERLYGPDIQALQGLLSIVQYANTANERGDPDLAKDRGLGNPTGPGRPLISGPGGQGCARGHRR